MHLEPRRREPVTQPTNVRWRVLGLVTATAAIGYVLRINLSIAGPSIKSELGSFLEASLAAGLASLPEVARQQNETGWPAAEMEAYLRRFRYRLGPEELEGLARFEELLRRHDLIDHD